MDALADKHHEQFQQFGEPAATLAGIALANAVLAMMSILDKGGDSRDLSIALAKTILEVDNVALGDSGAQRAGVNI
jgi:hypothetical protein